MNNVQYHCFWSNFNPDEFFLHRFFVELSERDNRIVKILGPFGGRSLLTRAKKLAVGLTSKYDFFVTGENKPPEFLSANKQIGFWKSYGGDNRVFRFPNWMWHLEWPGVDAQPKYKRYGMRLSIDRLMRPISESYSKEQLLNKKRRSVMFSSHLREPRRKLFKLTDSQVGCDGFGKGFTSNHYNPSKSAVLEQYAYSLCPENSLGDGYITEKIPEAFHAGCIPITWCRPEDLVVDFNSDAVINLYGLDDQQCTEIFLELSGEGDYIRKLRSVPLLKEKPGLEMLTAFVMG